MAPKRPAARPAAAETPRLPAKLLLAAAALLVLAAGTAFVLNVQPSTPEIQQHPDAPVAKRKAKDKYVSPPDWKPSHSEFVNNTATLKPLRGIDGVHVINLDRRPDRLESFMERSGLKPEEFNRFRAFDGKEIRWNPEIDRLFRANKFGSRAARIGCALSHLALYRHIASTENELHLILEDDALFEDRWIEKWNQQYSRVLPSDSALVYFGGVHPKNMPSFRNVVAPVNKYFVQHVPNTAYKHSFDPEVDLIDPAQPRRRFPYTGIAYALSSEGARILIDIIEKHGFIQPADIMRVKLLDLVDGCYTVHPLLVSIPEPTKHVAHADDSDIHYDDTILQGIPGLTDGSVPLPSQPQP